jgi:hypothetical protein
VIIGCDFFEVRDGYLNITQTSFDFKGSIAWMKFEAVFVSQNVNSIPSTSI